MSPKFSNIQEKKLHGLRNICSISAKHINAHFWSLDNFMCFDFYEDKCQSKVRFMFSFV